MKKFLSGIILFFVSFMIVDILTGFAMDYLNANVRGGDCRSHFDVFNHVTADVVILGSSRATHHYNPYILEDSLRLSCYNCGYDGLGIFNMYGRYSMICSRRIPKIVIYDAFAPNEIYDLDNLRDLDGLKQYCRDSSIHHIISDVSPMENLKLVSHLYRYNTKILQILHDEFSSRQEPEKGYRPLDGSMDYIPKPFKVQYRGKQCDSLKLEYDKKLILSAMDKGIHLFFAISPRYQATSYEDYLPLLRLCKQYHVPVLNHYCDKDFVQDKALFKDPMHLNQEGAVMYSKKIVQEVKQLLN